MNLKAQQTAFKQALFIFLGRKHQSLLSPLQQLTFSKGQKSEF